MEFEKYHVNISNIIPAQHYLCQEKIEKVKKSFQEYESYGNIYIIKYKNQIFSVDGHHRLYYLAQKGIREIEVINEIKDNEHLLYHILANESLKLGLRSIFDLENRIINSREDYQKKWIDKCQNILKNLKSKHC